MSETRVVRLSVKNSHVPVGSIDLPVNDSERAVSLLDDRDGMEAEKKSAGIGLCSARFRADLRVSGLRSLGLAPGDRLKAGTATLMITRIGKECFPECGLRLMGNPCGLSNGVVWAKVEQAGQVKLGDRLETSGKPAMETADANG
jgi:MOSC domain-containing protein YiiM